MSLFRLISADEIIFLCNIISLRHFGAFRGSLEESLVQNAKRKETEEKISTIPHCFNAKVNVQHCSAQYSHNEDRESPVQI